MDISKYVLVALAAIGLFSIWCGVSESTLSGDVGNVCYSSVPVLNEAYTQTEYQRSSEELEKPPLSDSSHSETRQPTFQPKRYISDDPYLEEQWALQHIHAPELWQVTTGNSQILVAVLDTGIDQHHEDLCGKIIADVNFTSSQTTEDILGHGTHVAGIIAANRNNGLGIVGLAPESSLLNVKVANDNGQSDISTVAEGIIWAVDEGASVINMSIALEEYSSQLEDAVRYAWSHGAVIVAAAGNSGGELPVYPALFENCIAVTGLRQDGTLAPLSNHGDWVDIAAPGFNIYSTLPGNSYGYKSGTSFATAYVSGLAALLFNVVSDSNYDGRLNDEVRLAIEAGYPIIDVQGVGRGCIDAAGSLLAMYDTNCVAE
jgi:thermitase